MKRLLSAKNSVLNVCLAIGFCSALCNLTACGQKGDLFLPADENDISDSVTPTESQPEETTAPKATPETSLPSSETAY